MAEQALINYIKQCRRQSILDGMIMGQLLAAGWDMDSIREAMKEASGAKGEILVRVQNLVKDYRPSHSLVVPALQGISLDIYGGEFFAITGPSGSGKTTFLNLLGLIDDPTTGVIEIHGQDISTWKEKEKITFRLHFISFIFQFFNLLDNYTALENIIFQLRLQGVGRRESKRRALEILNYLGLESKASSLPKELSGGEQQRVAIGRALAKDSLLILADEPTANLDTKNSENVIALLRDINKTFKKTVILVTHEPQYAQRADRMVTLRDGRIVSESAEQ